jgi:hypothetical protein
MSPDLQTHNWRMILTFSLVLMLTPTAPLFEAGPDRNWTTYSNAAYGYEIHFPAEFEATVLMFQVLPFYDHNVMKVYQDFEQAIGKNLSR